MSEPNDENLPLLASLTHLDCSYHHELGLVHMDEITFIILTGIFSDGGQIKRGKTAVKNHRKVLVNHKPPEQLQCSLS